MVGGIAEVTRMELRRGRGLCGGGGSESEKAKEHTMHGAFVASKSQYSMLSAER